MKVKKLIISLALVCISIFTYAQEKIDISDADYVNQQVEMADAFRADGKIYVVVAVVLVILLGLLLYLFLIDRKLTRLENELKRQP